MRSNFHGMSEHSLLPQPKARYLESTFWQKFCKIKLRLRSKFAGMTTIAEDGNEKWVYEKFAVGKLQKAIDGNRLSQAAKNCFKFYPHLLDAQH